ncbi:MAG: UDP-N-acetylmuramoyl-L-alanine--D-glutamate ligase, partial [Fusobacteria bacterium]|nr:UDP-N-acetylmuramoyl-L-alanine--D-glutamate ligase [Fusobacteriota bacterium]
MKNVLVYGAGVSAQGAMKLLEKKGVSYTLFCDDMGEIPNVEAFDVVLKSPGIPNNKLLLKMALLKGIEIIDEIELAYRFMPKNVNVVAITGTNGKTTTTLNM